MKGERLPSGLEVLVRPSRAEASLWRRFRVDDEPACREILFDRYAWLARSIALRHFRRRGMGVSDRSDFEHFAYEGLLQAIDRYDPLNGAPFSAYASRRIAGNIADGIAKMTEVGTQIRHRNRIEQERLRSLAASGVKADSEDAVSALSDLAVGLALGLMLEGTTLIDQSNRADPSPNAYESLEWRETQTRLISAIDALSEKEAAIIRYHYHNGLSFAQIADLFRLSRGRVSQLHAAALEKLRKKIGAFR